MKEITGYNEKAVSEAIGFILIFGIIILGIGLVTLYGYPVLIKQQSSADQRIMEKSMIVIQNDIKSLCYKSVPFKETTLKVTGGSLNVFNQSVTTQNFKIFKNMNPVYVFPLGNQFNPGELRYQSNDEGMIVTIENGAVIFRQYWGVGSTMLAEPRWFVDIDPIFGKTTIVIYLIGIDSTESLGRSGVGTVELVLNQTYYTQENLASGDIIRVTYTPGSDNDYSTAWGNYLINSLKYTDMGGGNYELIVPSPGTLVIKYYDVIVKSL